MPWEYSEKVLELFNGAVQGEAGSHMGEIPEADGCGEHGSLVCGDALKFTFRVRKSADPSQDRITQARFLTFGCTSAIASSEALCRLLEERSLTPLEALKVKNQDLVDYLGGLPEQKIHCSVMGAEALHAAVIDWAAKRGVDLHPHLPPEELEPQDEGRVVCHCFSVTEPYLRRKIPELGLKTIPEITNALKAGGGCTQCHHAPGGLQDLLDEIWGPFMTVPVEAGNAPREGEDISPYRLGRQIEEVIDRRIRPMLQADGGDIRLIDIKGFRVYCRLEGACRQCLSAGQTLKLLVEQQLKDGVDDRLLVVTVEEPP